MAWEQFSLEKKVMNKHVLIHTSVKVTEQSSK